MKEFLVIRHGSNAANQPMTPSAAVAIINAETEADARLCAETNVHHYVNQHLELAPFDSLTDEGLESWNDVVTRDAELRAVGEESIIYNA